ncbi:MAG: hypothetical protein QW674_08160 [Candidatus Bathyarchaeia archaeon]
MNVYVNKFFVVLALVALFIVLLAQMFKVNSDVAVQEKALSVIKDIVGLDVTKYNVELTSYFSDHPDNYGGLQREDVVYTLKAEGVKIEFSLRFVNKSLWFVAINPVNCSLLSAHYAKQLPTDILEITKAILQRLHTYSGEPHLQMLCDTMNKVADMSSVNATIGNLRRLVTINTNFISQNVTSTMISFYFMYTINNADSPKSVNIHFRDGALTGFSDGWYLFKIGSENIKISREEAIIIAQKEANKAATTELNFGNRSIRADLYMLSRNPFVLYPFWFVELPLNYPNSTITGWQVGIWADTGEIAYSHPTGILGTPPT